MSFLAAADSTRRATLRREERVRLPWLRLGARLDVIDRRLAEQEAALARLRELLRLPPRQSAFFESRQPTVSRAVPVPAVSKVAWLGAQYAFGVLARLAVSAALFALVLAAVAKLLNLLGRP